MAIVDTPPDEKRSGIPADQDEARRQDELSELRDLLLKPEQEQIEQLQIRLDDPLVHAEDISRVLPEAIHLRSQKDQQITKTLTPILEEAVKTSVKKNPRILVNAIFPIIGPAIRKAIATTLRGMVQSLSQMLDQSFSLKGLRWRFEALRTGKPFAEVVLLHTLVYCVEQVFLIHRETGIALHHVAAGGVAAQDPDLVSGMLTAIEEFVRDSFGEGKSGMMDTLQIGERTVWIEEGPLAILAVVIRGQAPPDLRSTLQDVIETIHFEQVQELEAFQGDTSPFEASRGHLEDCLQAQYRERKKRIAPVFWIVVGAVVLALLFLLVSSVRSHRRWQQYVEELRTCPGIIITSVEKSSGKHFISGFRDPLAEDPIHILDGFKLDPAKVESRWESYHSFHPDLVLIRARAMIDPPPTVTLTFQGGVLTATGTAPRQWILGARQKAPFVSGVTTFDDTQLMPSELGAMRALEEHIEKRSIRFVRGSTRLADAQEDAVADLISDIEHVLHMARDQGKDVHVTIVGHTDATGTEAVNTDLSHRRAEEMLAILVRRGLSADLFSTTGVGSSEPAGIEKTDTDRERNRRVTFRVEIRNGDSDRSRSEIEG